MHKQAFYVEAVSNMAPRNKLHRYSRQELLQMKERNQQLLNNGIVIGTLPDKGAKLRETNEIIEKLLLKPNIYDDGDISVENTHSHLDCPLTRRLEELTVLTPRQGARKRSVDIANQQSSIYNSRPVKHNRSNHLYAPKVKMISLKESMLLQTEQQTSVRKSDASFNYDQPSQGILQSLNLSYHVIRETNLDDVALPVTEEPEDYEEDECSNPDTVDSMVLD